MTVIIKDRNRIVISSPGPQGPAGAGGNGSGTVTSVTAGDGLLGGVITATGTIDVNFGSAGNTVCEGNDARLSDARTPTAHSHVAGDIGSLLGPGLVGRSAASSGTCERIGLSSALTINGSKQLDLANALAAASTTITAGTGLTGGGDLTANRTLAVTYGSSASTACEGNDARLSNARTPTAHNHAWSEITSGVPATFTPSAHTHALADLTQSSATSGQVVTWNGTAWAPATPSGGGGNTASTHYEYFNDMVTFGDLVFQTANSGSYGAIGTVGNLTGVVQIFTGTQASANARASLLNANPALSFAFDEETSYEFVASVSASSSFTAT
ncbi:MAG: hypothetical protein VKK63_12195, partial [Synechococcus sp.]|nr:hypothetical protein [Synechococcus sp.]